MARWFIPAIGFAAKAYIPTMEGMGDFKGIMHHTAVRPLSSSRADDSDGHKKEWI